METLKDVLIENSRYANKGLTFIDNNNDEFVSYKSLFEKSVKVLGALQNAGVKKGDELVFQIETNQEFVYVFWACILGGIIPVPVAVGNNDEHRHKIFRIWKYLNNPFLITDDKTIKNLERFSSEYKLESIKEIMGRTLMTDYIISDDTYNGIIENVEPDDIGYIQFSSGSTGDPKGVVLTHYNLMTNTRDILASSGTTQDDSLLAWVPLTHDMGLILFHLTGVVGGINEYMMLTKVFVQSPTIWIRKTNQYRATQLYSPNFGYKYFMSFLDESEQYDWDLSCVRIIWNGAEPISSKICEEFLSTMSRFKLSKEVMFPVYGMAEACVIATTPSLGQLYKCVSVDRNSLGIGSTVIEVKEGSENSVQLVEEGSCVANTRMRICDDKDNELPEMTVGHIQLKGENITSGYYNNAEATSKAFTADGWLRTGDLGFIKEGRIVVTGRAKEIIFVNGQNIYPYDIERIAESVGGIELGKIAACGVYINSNEKEEIVLFVYYKRKLSGFLRLEKELKQVVAQKMGLTVFDVVPVKRIPKTTSGKIQRYKLGEMYLNGEFNKELEALKSLRVSEMEDKLPQTGDSLEKKVLEMMTKTLDVEALSLDDNFLEKCTDSLKLVAAVANLEKELEISLSVSDFFAYPTVRKIASFIKFLKESDDSLYIQINGDISEYSPGYGYREEEINISIGQNIVAVITGLSQTVGVEPYSIMAASFIRMLQGICAENIVNVLISARDGSNLKHVRYAKNSLPEGNELYKIIFAEQSRLMDVNVDSIKRVDADNKDGMRFIPVFIKSQNERLISTKRNLFDLVFSFNPRNQNAITIKYNSKKFSRNRIIEITKLWMDILKGQ